MQRLLFHLPVSLHVLDEQRKRHPLHALRLLLESEPCYGCYFVLPHTRLARQAQLVCRN